MRGLGKQASLVLLNGRRVSNYALTDGAKDTFVNLDTFPADAIERDSHRTILRHQQNQNLRYFLLFLWKCDIGRG
jgi:hypothetical protein